MPWRIPKPSPAPLARRRGSAGAVATSAAQTIASMPAADDHSVTLGGVNMTPTAGETRRTKALIKLHDNLAAALPSAESKAELTRYEQLSIEATCLPKTA